MYGSCSGCPGFDESGVCMVGITTGITPVKQIELLEKWSAAHPRKTRQSVFMEQYPYSITDDRGILRICPADVYGNMVCPKNGKNARMICRNCRREFWMQEVE